MLLTTKHVGTVLPVLLSVVNYQACWYCYIVLLTVVSCQGYYFDCVISVVEFRPQLHCVMKYF